jgi:imidazole glycerol-phosphate synthase subunit HisH
VNLVIVNSGVGNVRSVANMLKRFHVAAEISDSPVAVGAADAVILPGVGSFDAAMQRIRQNGLYEVLDVKARAGTTPILGICLGMQLMGERSEEGTEPGFGWIGGELRKFRPDDGGTSRIRVPHMGWNEVKAAANNPLLAGFDTHPRFYFDHSYYFVPREGADCAGTTIYGLPFAAAVSKGLLFGVQFHPEKSHRFGLQLLKNFTQFVMAHLHQEEFARG